MPTPLFQLDSVELSYQRRQVLSDISLNIEKGEVVAIVGESGVGKSSLLEILRKQQQKTSAYAPQSDALVEQLSVFHNLYMGSLDRHHALYNFTNLLWPLNKPRKEVGDLATQLGLSEHLWSSASQLSGGQSRRTIIGRALYQKRTIFIGDEITSGLDEYQAEQMFQLILSRHETVVLALHNVDLALKYCSRIIALKNQRIALDVNSRDISSADLSAIYSADKCLS